jgi:hypothetical protein
MKQLSNSMRPDVPATGRPSGNVSVLSHWKHRMTCPRSKNMGRNTGMRRGCRKWQPGMMSRPWPSTSGLCFRNGFMLADRVRAKTLDPAPPRVESAIAD